MLLIRTANLGTTGLRSIAGVTARGKDLGTRLPELAGACEAVNLRISAKASQGCNSSVPIHSGTLRGFNSHLCVLKGTDRSRYIGSEFDLL